MYRKNLTLAGMRKKNKQAGHFFFSKGAMQFFNSRIETPGYWDKEREVWWFIYSNQLNTSQGMQPRYYKVAFMKLSGKVTNNILGQHFQGWPSLEAATKFRDDLRGKNE